MGMSPRELAGAINKAQEVCVYVEWDFDPMGYSWVAVPKVEAKKICDEAREAGIAEIEAEWDAEVPGVLLIGDLGDEEDEDDDKPEFDSRCGKCEAGVEHTQAEHEQSIADNDAP